MRLLVISPTHLGTSAKAVIEALVVLPLTPTRTEVERALESQRWTCRMEIQALPASDLLVLLSEEGDAPSLRIMSLEPAMAYENTPGDGWGD